MSATGAAVTVETLLSEAVRLSDAALARALPPADAEPARLHAAMRYTVFAGGKRVRPALALAACRACGGADDAVAPALAALELLHTYTLVHDDLPAMDDDDLRRGRPTCHKAFDEATAILAGDALQCLAFETVAALGAEAVVRLARASGSLGVIGGQQDDLDAENAPRGANDPARRAAEGARLERIHRRKTAALIAVSCELGAIAARAPGGERARLCAFGEAVGLAFQIADDVLDATATAAELGKTPGKDAAQGKLTYVAVYGLEAARREAARLAAEAQAALGPFGAAAAPLAALARFIVERRT
ncbi:MAG TPA: farnesyl diphosphate synthase [Planctomycetota bacterium]|nr:farnesyl diphosphate synthase [Planctomycetota bacterium]